MTYFKDNTCSLCRTITLQENMGFSAYHSGVARCQKVCVCGGGGGGAHRHVIYVPSVK